MLSSHSRTLCQLDPSGTSSTDLSCVIDLPETFPTFITVLLHSQIDLTIWKSSFFFLGQILFHKGPIFISKCHIKPYNILLLLLCFEFSVVKSKQNGLKISYILLVCATIQHQTHQTHSDTFSFQQGLLTLELGYSCKRRVLSSEWGKQPGDNRDRLNSQWA